MSPSPIYTLLARHGMQHYNNRHEFPACAIGPCRDRCVCYRHTASGTADAGRTNQRAARCAHCAVRAVPFPAHGIRAGSAPCFGRGGQGEGRTWGRERKVETDEGVERGVNRGRESRAGNGAGE